jgi:hypothetical protein
MSGEEVRERLIDALLRQAARGGIEDLSVRAIAAEAGVNHGLVHRHFGSKGELVRAAIARTAGRIMAGGAPGIASRTFAVLAEGPEIRGWSRAPASTARTTTWRSPARPPISSPRSSARSTAPCARWASPASTAGW